MNRKYHGIWRLTWDSLWYNFWYMKSLTMTEARKGFFELVRKTNQTQEAFHIRHKEGDAVLMSAAEYESLQETLELLSIPEFRKSIAKSKREADRGQTLGFEEVFGETQ